MLTADETGRVVLLPSVGPALSSVRQRADQLSKDFDREGYFVWGPPAPPLLDETLIGILRTRLDNILKDGSYDLGKAPTKVPKASIVRSAFAAAASGLLETSNKATSSDSAASVSTLQIINVRFCDSLFQQVIHSSVLGEIVTRVTGWSGCRVAQDQVWVKPPGCGPLSFHRDSPYFDFEPADVCTLWLTLDDLTTEEASQLGPLEYCPGSHKWGESRTGTANQFFSANYTALLESAALKEGYSVSGVNSPPEGQETLTPHKGPMPAPVAVRVQAGGFSIHNGRLWHGSGPNKSKTLFRRGLGIHFVPATVTFSPSKGVGKLWMPYYLEALALHSRGTSSSVEQESGGSVAGSSSLAHEVGSKTSDAEGETLKPKRIDILPLPLPDAHFPIVFSKSKSECDH